VEVDADNEICGPQAYDKKPPIGVITGNASLVVSIHESYLCL
jgi:hypothetical protein